MAGPRGPQRPQVEASVRAELNQIQPPLSSRCAAPGEHQQTSSVHNSLLCSRPAMASGFKLAVSDAVRGELWDGMQHCLTAVSPAWMQDSAEFCLGAHGGDKLTAGELCTLLPLVCKPHT
jgi:hypothetical protein